MTKFNFICTALIIGLTTQRAISQTRCSPCECHDDSSHSGGMKAVCSGLNLTRIPALPRETTTLLMDSNNFFSLPQRAFARMKKLKHLDLSDNRFLKLTEHVFSGLDHLEVLILDGNYLYNCTSLKFDPVFLRPLRGLRTFSLSGQNICLHLTLREPPLLYSARSYPGSLQNLYIDCVFCRFEPSFLRLKNISLLSLTSDRRGLHCAMQDMDNTTFQHTPYLETLNISDCEVYNVKPGLFSPLQNLRKLDMSMFLTDQDEFNAFNEATKSLQFSPIEYLKFVSFHSVQTSPNLFSHLQNTTLKELHMISKLYPLIDKHTLEKLPRSLEVLTFKHFQYAAMEVFTELKRHPTLNILDLSGVVLSDDSHYKHSDDVLLTQSLFSISPVVETYICGSCHCSNFLGFPGHGMIPYVKPEIGIKHIKRLIIPDNGITYYDNYSNDKMPFVEYIDISKNRLYNLHPFPKNNSISYLSVAGNRLGNFLASENTSTLASLSQLQTVDFSDNDVFSLSTNGLDQLQRVKVINVSNNYLEIINVRLLHLNDLEVLDLSNNKIHVLGENTRNDLSLLPKARLHLDGNPLVCGCDELDSLLWIKQNRRRIHNLESLHCRLPTEKHAALKNLDEIITNLQTLCKSNIVEISVSICVTVSVLSLVAGVLVYRHRWKLRYLYHAGRRGYIRRYNQEYIHLEEYQYDAFVSYADPDRRFVIDEMIKELEDKHGLKLCVHHRDFLPGEVISDNIVNAIQNSRKTIVVLSPGFLKSDWCEFEFNMARMEGVSRRQDIVLMLLYEDVSMMNLSKDMATMLKRNCYLEYNHEVFNKEIFWFSVQESIQIIRQKD